MSCSMAVIDKSPLSRFTVYNSELEIVFDPEEHCMSRFTCHPVSYREYMGYDDSDDYYSDEYDSDDYYSDHVIIKNQRGEGWT